MSVLSYIALKVKVKSLSHVRLSAAPWTVAYQASLSMGFSRQEYWSGLPFPSPGDLPNPGIKPESPALEADALTSEPPGKPRTVILPFFFFHDIGIFDIFERLLNSCHGTEQRWANQFFGQDPPLVFVNKVGLNTATPVHTTESCIAATETL